MYAFHPGHQFACHLQSRPKKDLGALSYFARNPQFSQLWVAIARLLRKQLKKIKQVLLASERARPTTNDQRLPSLPRHQRHLMRPVLLDRGRREGKREGRASVPRRPLVHVIRTEEDSALSRHQVQRAFVKVRKVPRQPFGRPKPPAHRFHRVRAPAQRMQSRPREAPNQRKLAEHQMIDFNRIIFSPLPLTEVGRNFAAARESPGCVCFTAFSTAAVSRLP